MDEHEHRIERLDRVHHAVDKPLLIPALDSLWVMHNPTVPDGPEDNEVRLRRAWADKLASSSTGTSGRAQAALLLPIPSGWRLRPWPRLSASPSRSAISP
jgi:hypothetical protein